MSIFRAMLNMAVGDKIGSAVQASLTACKQLRRASYCFSGKHDYDRLRKEQPEAINQMVRGVVAGITSQPLYDDLSYDDKDLIVYKVSAKIGATDKLSIDDLIENLKDDPYEGIWSVAYQYPQNPSKENRIRFGQEVGELLR